MTVDPFIEPVRVMLGEPDDRPVLLFDPGAAIHAAQTFRAQFPGLTSYAVKANPHDGLLRALIDGGITAFDVASPAEMQAVRAILPDARLHYHNPVRSPSEVACARAFGVESWSVDRPAELDKIGPLDGAEIAVRLKLPVTGAAYDFGAKFGAEPAAAEALLKAVAARGGRPAMTFHPGTQCTDPGAWAPYIEACARIAARAGVRLARLNVGGGFPACRGLGPAPLAPHFAAIRQAADAAFSGDAPPLVCEPGRALATEAMQLGLRVKARDGATLFLNDGVYGALGEWRDMGVAPRLRVFDAAGTPRRGARGDFTVFGPTCDSLDRLPGTLSLPAAIAEGDIVLIAGMGAYSHALTTGFNGYGAPRIIALAAPARAGRDRAKA